MEKRKKRRQNFFMTTLLLLLVKLIIAKIDVFGTNSLLTGFIDVLIITIIALVSSAISSKNRLLLYSLFSLTFGLLIIIFRTNSGIIEKPFSFLSLLYFTDTIVIFTLYLLIRRTKNLKKENIPTPPKIAYILLAVFIVLSGLSVTDAFAVAGNKISQAKDLGFFAYSLSNPTLYAIAESVTADASKTDPTISPTPTDNPTVTPSTSPEATPTPTVTPTTTPTPTPKPALKNLFALAKGKNIIVIQFESLQNICVNAELNGVEITPNVNNLIKDSVYFENAMTQIAKGSTSDAEFAFNTSLYPFADSVAFNEKADRDYIGIADLMNTAGYTTSTFHTNSADFFNRKNMYPLLGYKNIYDKKYFGTQYMTSYGSSDYYLYKKTLPILKKYKASKKPFFADMLTVSSHNPFVIPSWMKTVSFGKKFDPTLTGLYLRTVNYSDRQLGMFIKDLKAAGLYDDTLIVLYGDHFALSEGRIKNWGLKSNSSVLNELLGRNYDILDQLNVPLVIKLPKQKSKGTIISMPAGQVDIMPTILNLAGIENKKGKMFGVDLFNTKQNFVGFRGYFAPADSYASNSRLYLGNEYSIDYSHEESNIKLPATVEENMIISKIIESDAYVKSLPKIKKK